MYGAPVTHKTQLTEKELEHIIYYPVDIFALRDYINEGDLIWLFKYVKDESLFEMLDTFMRVLSYDKITDNVQEQIIQKAGWHQAGKVFDAFDKYMILSSQDTIKYFIEYCPQKLFAAAKKNGGRIGRDFLSYGILHYHSFEGIKTVFENIPDGTILSEDEQFAVIRAYLSKCGDKTKIDAFFNKYNPLSDTVINNILENSNVLKFIIANRPQIIETMSPKLRLQLIQGNPTNLVFNVMEKNITDHEQIEFIISIRARMNDKVYRDLQPDFNKTLSTIRSRTLKGPSDKYGNTLTYITLLDNIMEERSVHFTKNIPEFVMLALLRTDMGDKIKWYKMVENMLFRARISDNVLKAMIVQEPLTKRMVEKYYPEYFKPKQQAEQPKQRGCLFTGLFGGGRGQRG